MKKILTLFCAVNFLLLAACQDPYKAAISNKDTGTVTVRIGDGAHAVSAGADIQQFSVAV